MKQAKRTAVYPGSFDPITNGHVDIIRRIAPLFDELVVLISHSADKKAMFSDSERAKMAKEVLKDFKTVKVAVNEGLTVNYVREYGAKYIIRGVRSEADVSHESVVANMNKDLYSEVETLIIFARPELSHISSRAVKEAVIYGGDPKHWVAPLVAKELKKKVSSLRGS